MIEWTVQTSLQLKDKEMLVHKIQIESLYISERSHNEYVCNNVLIYKECKSI